MRRAGGISALAAILGMSLAMTTGARVLRAQEGGNDARPADPALQAVEKGFQAKLRQLQVDRIEKLAGLAAGQEGKNQSATYEQCLEHVIVDGLFAEGEPAAEAVLKRAADFPPQVVFLAEVVAIQARAARGAYAESLELLTGAVNARAEADAAPKPGFVLDPALQTSLVELYYQKLTQADQFDLARRAMALLGEKSRSEPVKVLAARRLKQLEMIGKPAPAVGGLDLDGKPVSLAGYKGDVVLLIFWATWCEPTTDAVPRLLELERAYKDRGFRILGVNVDGLSAGGPGPDAVRSLARRFAIDQNADWPNLVAEPGPSDPTGAFGVTEIPSSFLIGRDGTIRDLDLTEANDRRSIEKALDAAK
jgi:thiol-disulfide isomerase/thioredoxin